MGKSRYSSGFVDLNQMGSKDVVRVCSQIASTEAIQLIYRHCGPVGLWTRYAVLTDMRVISIGRGRVKDILINKITVTGTRFGGAWMRNGRESLRCSFGSRDDANQFLALLNEARTRVNLPVFDNTAKVLANRISRLMDLSERGALNDDEFKRCVKEELVPYL